MMSGLKVQVNPKMTTPHPYRKEKIERTLLLVRGS